MVSCQSCAALGRVCQLHSWLCVLHPRVCFWGGSVLGRDESLRKDDVGNSDWIGGWKVSWPTLDKVSFSRGGTWWHLSGEGFQDVRGDRTPDSQLRARPWEHIAGTALVVAEKLRSRKLLCDRHIHLLVHPPIILSSLSICSSIIHPLTYYPSFHTPTCPLFIYLPFTCSLLICAFIHLPDHLPTHLPNHPFTCPLS